MSLRNDTVAASPLTVIVTFVLIAAGLTALAFFTLVDRTDEAMNVRRAQSADGPVIEVTRVIGDYSWRSLDVEFLDAAGVDKADLYLDLPRGNVDEGDRITFVTVPPAGSYYLEARLDGALVIRSHLIL